MDQQYVYIFHFRSCVEIFSWWRCKLYGTCL